MNIDIDITWLETSGFDWRKAYTLAIASELAYRSPKQVKRVLASTWGLEAQVFSDKNTQGFIAVGAETAIVSFRGTKGFGDWLGSLNVGKKAFYPINGHVHGGFLDAWKDAEDTIRAALENVGNRTLWFTGHSLGGAIAVIAATALADYKPAGVITFGQPRMLDENAAHFLANNFQGQYARIVNNDDIITRIPPGYRHSGQLYRFDSTGNLIRQDHPFERMNAGAIDSKSDDLSPLSEQEYQEFVGVIEENKRNLEEQEFNLAIEGVFPETDDHRINTYINLCRRQAFPTKRLDIREALASLEARSIIKDANLELYRGLAVEASSLNTKSTASGEEDGVSPWQAMLETRQPMLIKLYQPEWTPPDGMPIGSRLGTIITAQASRADLLAIERDSNVESVEVSRETGTNDPKKPIDHSGANPVYRPPIPERGNACLIGIIDSGLDILHHAFRGADGQCRIVAVWDQLGSGGLTPHQVDKKAFTQNYGRLYLKHEIQQFINDYTAGTPTHPNRLRDLRGHGTHVAGIAAGRATSQQPDGIAPEAGIVVVMSSLSQAHGYPLSIGYSNSHIDGLAFMKRVAEGNNSVLKNRLPIAINISEGMNAGAHDGSTMLEAALDSITNIGKTPGCVIVKSAGNERRRAGHALKKVFEGIELVHWKRSKKKASQDYFEAWFDRFDDIAFTLVDPQRNRSDEVSFEQPDIRSTLGGNICHLLLTKGHVDNGDNRLTITILSSPQPIQSGIWRLELKGREILSDKGHVNIWVEHTRSRTLCFDVEEEEMTLSVPGTAKTVICVAACNSESPLRLNRSSSWGLTRDGRRKPDLSAPGNKIISAQSACDPEDEATVPDTGTSMAAPHVTGALALVMSHRENSGQPQLNAVQLRAGLTRTVYGVPNRHHIGLGYGVLNIEKLFDYFK